MAMPTLHEALQALQPLEFADVPVEPENLENFINNTAASARRIVDSVPRAGSYNHEDINHLFADDTLQSYSNGESENPDIKCISADAVRSQQEWGKPVKLSAKDNPLHMSVYKLAGKDGKGAWFARRSLHYGLEFRKWRAALQDEFPETLKVQGGPGEGSVRGIGAERRVEHLGNQGHGMAEVYHLSAQFPGPTTPRDFVTLLLSPSDSHHETSSDKIAITRSEMKISKPCFHHECPDRDGFIRGRYESVEFVRELPLKTQKGTSRRRSTSLTLVHAESAKAALSPVTPQDIELQESHIAGSANPRARSKTLSAVQPSHIPMQSNDDHAQISDDKHVIEWIMVTRSDPGGSVPRFMVERGTPGGIVADAGKFLEWAEQRPTVSTDTDSTLLNNASGHAQECSSIGTKIPNDVDIEKPAQQEAHSVKDTDATRTAESQQENGIMESLTSVLTAGVGSLTPKAILNGQTQLKSSDTSNGITNVVPNDSTKGDEVLGSDDEEDDAFSDSSSVSFASAETFLGDAKDKHSRNGHTTNTSSQDASIANGNIAQREQRKLEETKRQISEKLAKAKEKESKGQSVLSDREKNRIQKLESKYAREIQKQEERCEKEIARQEAKVQKARSKEIEQKRRAEEKDEKLKLRREAGELRQQLDLITRERDLFKQQVGLLQTENTSLTARLGALTDSRDVLKEIQLEKRSSKSSLGRGSRSASGSTSQTSRLLHDSPTRLRSNESASLHSPGRENVPPLKPS